MLINEIEERQIYDFHWDSDREGFVATLNGEEIGFHKAKSIWDRNDAQRAAKSQLFTHQHNKTKQIMHNRQMDPVLTNHEQEWIALDKKAMASIKNKTDDFTEKEIARWNSLAEVVRKSIINGEHPAAQYRKH